MKWNGFSLICHTIERILKTKTWIQECKKLKWQLKNWFLPIDYGEGKYLFFWMHKSIHSECGMWSCMINERKSKFKENWKSQWKQKGSKGVLTKVIKYALTSLENPLKARQLHYTSKLAQKVHQVVSICIVESLLHSLILFFLLQNNRYIFISILTFIDKNSQEIKRFSSYYFWPNL